MEKSCMSNQPHKAVQAHGLNSAIRALHDELKSLVLTCAPEFPKDVRGGLKFVADIVDLQGMVGSYNKQVLVLLFHSAASVESTSPVLARATSFIRPWKERGRLSNKESRSENEIDTAVRKRMSSVLQKMLPLGEEELLTLNRNEDIPELLYYLSTVEQALCWYAGRCLARMNGELAKMEM
jgi:hypothetical protein